MMQRLLKSCTAALIAPAALVLAALSVPLARARSGPWNQERGGLDVQRGRDERIGARGAKTYYTKRWDLSDVPPYQPQQKVSGTIRVWGSGYFAQGSLGRYWEEGFRQRQPDVKFEYHFQAPALAIPALCVGISDLAPSRHITFDETLMFQRVFDRDPVEISMRTDVARSAIDNIRTWGQLGSTGEWTNKRIHVYGYNLRYHIPRTFERLVFRGGDKWNEELHEYANYKNSDGTNMLEAQEVIDAIGKDPYGIGYSSVAYLTPVTKALAVAPRAGGEYVELNLETLRNRTYPLFDEVYFYVNRVPGKPVDPKVKEFLSYVLSREGQDAVQRDAKYLPLTSEVVRQQRKKLE